MIIYYIMYLLMKRIDRQSIINRNELDCLQEYNLILQLYHP